MSNFPSWLIPAWIIIAPAIAIALSGLVGSRHSNLAVHGETRM